MSTRTQKLGSVMHAAVQDVISRGLGDPRVRGLVSVTKVEVTDDLAEARVYVSVLPAFRQELTMHGLADAAGHIQRQIAPAITAKRMPRLRFVVDDSLKRQAALDAAIAGSDESSGPDADSRAGAEDAVRPVPEPSPKSDM